MRADGVLAIVLCVLAIGLGAWHLYLSGYRAGTRDGFNVGVTRVLEAVNFHEPISMAWADSVYRAEPW